MKKLNLLWHRNRPNKLGGKENRRDKDINRDLQENCLDELNFHLIIYSETSLKLTQSSGPRKEHKSCVVGYGRE